MVSAPSAQVVARIRMVIFVSCVDLLCFFGQIGGFGGAGGVWEVVRRRTEVR